MTRLQYTCPGCGTPLGYEGLCWKCKSEQERNAALAWTPEQITEKQRNLIQNIQRLAEMEEPEFTDFWQLLSYHNAIAPEIQRAALAAEVFWPCSPRRSSGRHWPQRCSGPVRSIITLPPMCGMV